jgi:sirohydrochlorin cobaltochelatase
VATDTGKNSIGLLVVGHGTRKNQGKQDFWTTVGHVAAELPQTVVEGCFLEAGTPDIPTALKAMAQRGLREVVLAPLLLFSAGHAERDIPAAARQAAADAHVTVQQTDVLGCHPEILALSAARFRSAIGVPYAPARVLWLFVGRGSSDAAATAEMDRFAVARVALTPVGRTLVAYLAMAEPRVESVVAQIAAMDFAAIVVQPHLLYPGTLLSRLQHIVAEQDHSQRRQHWMLADCLGCDRAIARVVVERFRAAIPVG